MGKRVFLILLLFLTSCNQSKTPVPVKGSPLPGTPPANATEATSTTLIPKPDKNNGVVIGQLVMLGSNQPLAGAPVYLAEILPLEPGPGHMLTVQANSSPHTLTDDTGHFALSATPGKYVLMLWTPIHSQVLINPDTNSEWEVNVEAEQTTDAGKVEAEWP